MTFRDPKGNELRAVLLQVMERDEHKMPLVLRMRYDHEPVKLDTGEGEPTTFWMVWAPRDLALGELRLSDLTEELDRAKVTATELSAELVLQNRRIDSVTREYAAITEENRVKTEALRVLQKERDPEHVERIAKEHVDKATAKLDGELRAALSREADLKSQLAEAKEAKKRLREALDRAKGK